MNASPSTAGSYLHSLPTMATGISLSSQVQTVIMEAVQVGALAPGQRLLVDDVAAHFGVSKIPVREAFKALEASGWLESRPRRGTFVTLLSGKELRSVFEMRRILEPPSAGLAAMRRTPEQLTKLGNLIDEGTAALASGDVVKISQVNSQFHTVLAQAVNNEILSNAVADLEFRLRRYFIAVDWQQRSESISQHKAIFEAIRSKNAELAKRLTIAHINHTETLALNTAVLDESIQKTLGWTKDELEFL